jgi:ABC-type multidrug transport system, ATPase and permease components
MIKKLSASIREYKRQSILAPILITAEVGFDVLIPFLMSYIIDIGIKNENIRNVWIIGGLLLLCTIFALFCGIQSGVMAAEASAGFAKNLRKDMYYSIQDYSFKNIDKYSSASLITRLTTDVTNVQNSYQMIIRMLVRSPMIMIFAFLMSVKINAKLSLVFLGAMLFLGISLYTIIRIAYPIFMKIFRMYDDLNRVVQENLRGIRVVKSYVREEEEIKKFSTTLNNIFEKFIGVEKIITFNSPIMLFTIYSCTLLFSWFGAKLIVSNELTTGELVSFIAYTMQILMGLMMLSMAFVMIVISRASAERIVEVLEEQSDIKNNPNPIYEITSGDIEFENINFKYKSKSEKLCLDSINISIKSGETVGIVGGTGSGKSTLVQLITRLYDVDSGIVKVGGIDVRKYDIHTLRNEVAIVLQKNTLFSGTIKENLRWGNPNATDKELINACNLACAHEFIENFPNGYDTYIEEGGTNVSGGQRQRICIARAILKTPKILILDDSTSAVDTKTDASIREAFANYIPNTTKIIIAQRIASVEQADKIIVMESGKIQAIGTHDELMHSSDIYKEVYLSQVKGGDENDAA